MRIGLFLVVVGLFGASPAAAKERVKIAVLDVVSTGVDANVAPLLSEVLTSEVHALKRFDVIAGSDIAALIGFEKQRDLVGCTDEACMAEIGGALGVDQILVAHVGKIGSTFLVNVKLIDIRNTKVVDRVSETVKGEIDVLISTVKAAVTRLFAEPAPQPAATSSEKVIETAPTTTARQEVTTGGVGALPIAMWAIGGVALGAGVYFNITARGHAANANDENFIGGQREIDAAESAQTISFVGLGVGVAAIATGFALWASSGESAEPPPVSVVPTASLDAYGFQMTMHY